MKINYVFLVVFIVSTKGYAQTDSLKQMPYYFNTFLSGTLIGDRDGVSGQEFTVSFTSFHGIAFQSGARLALGSGLDTYTNWRMIPLLFGLIA